MTQKIFSITSFSLLLLLPVAVFAAPFDAGTRPGLSLSANTQTILTIITKIFSILWIVFIAFAIIMFIWAGFLFLKAEGEPGEVSTARKALLWGVIGVIVAVLAFTIPYFVKNTITPQQQGNSNCDNGAWQASGYASEDDCYAAYGGR